MTAHELANVLLSYANVPVCFYEYTGGPTPLFEVGQVEVSKGLCETVLILYTDQSFEYD